jgi:hypothetical protein
MVDEELSLGTGMIGSYCGRRSTAITGGYDRGSRDDIEKVGMLASTGSTCGQSATGIIMRVRGRYGLA